MWAVELVPAIQFVYTSSQLTGVRNATLLSGSIPGLGSMHENLRII